MYVCIVSFGPVKPELCLFSFFYYQKDLKKSC